MKWIVVTDWQNSWMDDYIDSVTFKTFNTKQEAIEYYEECKIGLNENEIGLTGDEYLCVALITNFYGPVTVEKDNSCYFEFEEWNDPTNGFFLTKEAYTRLVKDKPKNNKNQNKCDYCQSIDKATPSSPRHKYIYCPMCGKKRVDAEFYYKSSEDYCENYCPYKEQYKESPNKIGECVNCQVRTFGEWLDDLLGV